MGARAAGAAWVHAAAAVLLLVAAAELCFVLTARGPPPAPAAPTLAHAPPGAEAKALGSAEGQEEGKAEEKAAGKTAEKAAGKAEEKAEGKTAGKAEEKAAEKAEGKAAGEGPGPALVLVLTAASALAAGGGALPFLWLAAVAPAWVARCNAAAAGLMAAACATLLLDAAAFGLLSSLAGVAAGALFVACAGRLLGVDEAAAMEQLAGGPSPRRVVLFLAVMTLHSFSEGVGMGVSFGAGRLLGSCVTAAIAIHNVPEGLAVALVLLPRGFTPLQALGWAVLSSLPQPLMALPAFWFVEVFAPLLPLGLGFAAGAMLWVVATELGPEALDGSVSRCEAVSWGVASFSGMCAFQLAMDVFFSHNDVAL